MDFSEKWGTDIENAVELALIDLKLSRDEVEVIVLEEPSKGFFGIGSKLAKVRVQKKARPEEQQPKPAPEREEKKEARETPAESVSGISEKNQERRERKKPADRKRTEKQAPKEFYGTASVRRERPENLRPASEDNRVLVFIRELSEKMGLDVSVSAMENEENVYVDIEGKDSGTIIGKRGQTLDAIQYLASLVGNKGDDRHIKVVIDAENYRQKREKTLEQLANRLAMKVIKSRKNIRLEPMNPYERKVIHSTLQNNPSVTTRSEGEEPYRRVIIELK